MAELMSLSCVSRRTTTMIRYSGPVIRDCVSFAASVADAVRKAPDYIKGTDGKWYHVGERGIDAVPPALAGAFEKMPVCS